MEKDLPGTMEKDEAISSQLNSGDLEQWSTGDVHSWLCRAGLPEAADVRPVFLDP